MVTALYVIAGVIFMISLITGFLSGSFLGFVIAVASGIGVAMIFFGMAQIITNQEHIIKRLQNQEEFLKKSSLQKKITCASCGKEHDADYSSCPYCGFRG